MTEGEFKEMVEKFLADTRMSERDMAVEFRIPVSTVRRWANGVACPHRYMREHVLDWIVRRYLVYLLRKLGI